jgi:hypothetical protein
MVQTRHDRSCFNGRNGGNGGVQQVMFTTNPRRLQGVYAVPETSTKKET